VIPTWLAHVIHPAIVLLSVPLTAAALLVRRRLSAGDLFALLALCFLLRCLLDPVDNAYYHVPFLLSLAFWEGLGRRRRRLPVFTILASVAIWFAFYKATMSDAVAFRNAVYLAATLPFAVGLAMIVYGRRGGRQRSTSPDLRAVPVPGG
jgi:hypothetical protein